MIKQSRLSIHIPESLHKDIIKYLAKRAEDGKLRGMKTIFGIVALMDKLKETGELGFQAKKDCEKLIGETARFKV